MDPAEATAGYRAGLEQSGEAVTLRVLGAGGKVARETGPIWARVTGYKPEELVAGIQQGDLKVLLLAEDVAASGFPALANGSAQRVFVRGANRTIMGIDDNTRRVAGVLIAYQLQVRG